MDASALIENYGYLALVVGTFFEGEVVLIFGGYAARSGHLAMPWVLCCGALGVFCSDWTCFLLGRWCSKRLLRWFPGMQRKLVRPLALLEQRRNWFIIAFQFVPGTSTVTPIAIGMSQVSAWQFLLLDLVGIGIWTLLFAGLGYLFGAAMGLIISDLHRYDAWLAALFAIILVLWWRRFRRPTNTPPHPPPCPDP